MLVELSAFIRANSRCFDRTLAAGHVTASAWIVDESHAYTLLTHHRKLGRWMQLGGHADGDDNVRRVALGEATEESGLASLRFALTAIYDVDVHAIPERGPEAAHKHYDVRFALIADRTVPTVVSAESHDLAWVPLRELHTYDIDESVRRLARKTNSLT